MFVAKIITEHGEVTGPMAKYRTDNNISFENCAYFTNCIKK